MSAWHKGSDMHAAAGHSIATDGAGYRGMPDCPACKYGTLVAGETDDTMTCIDCKAVHTVKRLVELHVLPNAGHQFRSEAT